MPLLVQQFRLPLCYRLPQTDFELCATMNNAVYFFPLELNLFAEIVKSLFNLIVSFWSFTIFAASLVVIFCFTYLFLTSAKLWPIFTSNVAVNKITKRYLYSSGTLLFSFSSSSGPYSNTLIIEILNTQFTCSTK